MASLENQKRDLAAAVKHSSRFEQKPRIACILAEALETIGQQPVLVGGAAVEFYTAGEYSTEDIDMVTPGGPDLARVMAELGFERLGKDYVHRELKIYAEFPGSYLKPNERFAEIDFGDKKLRIISVEDLIVDRLCAFKYWSSAIDGVNAMLLLENEITDENRLFSRAAEEEVIDALDTIKQVREEVIRKSIPSDQASELLKKKMRALKTI